MNRLKQVTAHTLIVAGTEDFQFPPEHQRQLQNGITGADLQLLSGAGHNAHIEQSEEMVDILGQFLRNG